MNYKITDHYSIVVLKWYDKVNGNTYHNVKIKDHHGDNFISSGVVYGYGNQYLVTAAGLIKDYNGDELHHNDLLPCIIAVVNVNTKKELKNL